jgi:hypothetical protein
MINLYDNNTNAFIGSISEHDLQYLIDNMEEEFPEDTDYSITPMELAFFEQNNAPAELIGTLRQALGEREEVIIRWTRSE